MKYIITIILIFGPNLIKACECVEFEYSGKHVRQFFHWSDKVFIGNLLENNAGEYKFEVIKGFKNCEFRDTLWGKYNNSCSITPNEKGLWIVYASIQDSTNNEINIDGCNSTRSLISDRQFLYDGYDTSSDFYNLQKEQTGKLVELSILDALNENQSFTKKPLTKLTNIDKRKNMNWMSLLAIVLSIVAILMNIQMRIKARR